MNSNAILKNLRVKLGLTQAQFAQKLGVPQQNVSRWEKGEHNPSKKTLENIEAIFNVTINPLFADLKISFSNDNLISLLTADILNLGENTLFLASVRPFNNCFVVTDYSLFDAKTELVADLAQNGAFIVLPGTVLLQKINSQN